MSKTQKASIWIVVGMVALLGSIAGCGGTSFGEREEALQAERKQLMASQEQELAEFAERHNAIMVEPKFFPDMFEDLEEEEFPTRNFTAQLQERIEGSVIAFRGYLIEVVRTSGNNYQLVFGEPFRGPGKDVVVTLSFNRRDAAKLIEDSPNIFEKLLVAARIDRVEPIILEVRSCSVPLCEEEGEEMQLGIIFRSPLLGNPPVRIFGTAIAVTRSKVGASFVLPEPGTK